MSFSELFVPGEAFRDALQSAYWDSKAAREGFQGITVAAMVSKSDAWPGWGLHLSKLHCLSSLGFALRFFDRLGLFLAGPKILTVLQESALSVSAVVPKAEADQPDLIPTKLEDVLGFQDDEAVLNALEHHFWCCSRGAFLDLLAEPTKDSREFDLRMFFDAILLAVAPYISKDKEPSLFLEACKGSVDYRIGAVSLELKRDGGLKICFPGDGRSPHLQTLCGMVTAKCTLGVASDGERFVFHANTHIRTHKHACAHTHTMHTQDIEFTLLDMRVPGRKYALRNR
eukprot:1341483-Karenia_brevis.AAC.1